MDVYSHDMTVLLNTINLNAVKSTDLDYIRNFSSMESLFDEVAISVNDDFISAGTWFLSYLFSGFLRYIPPSLTGILCQTGVVRYASSNLVPRSILERTGADIIFSHDVLPLVAGSRIPVVVDTWYVADDYLTYKGILKIKPFILSVKRFWAERSTLMVMTLDGDIRRFNRDIPGFEDKLRRVPPFLPYLDAIPEPKMRDKFASDEVTMVFVGKDKKRKGLLDVLEAIEHLNTDKKVTLRVASDIEKHTVRYGNITVDYLGLLSKKEVMRQLEMAHIFVLPSYAESYGYSLVEALAKGCALVVSNIPSFKEISLDTALRCEPGDVGSLRSIIETLVNDRTKTASLAAEGVKLFKAEYDPVIAGHVYMRIFAEAREIDCKASGKGKVRKGKGFQVR